MAKKKVKVLKIDFGKCTGCRACEVICTAFHASPEYDSVNPPSSRIRVLSRELNNVFIPVIASADTKAECLGRNVYTPDGNECGACAFCCVSCLSRDKLKEPDSRLLLKFDMCEGEDEPLCVKWCLVDALSYEEREEVEEKRPEEMGIGLEALSNEYGLDKIMDTVTRMSMSKKN